MGPAPISQRAKSLYVHSLLSARLCDLRIWPLLQFAASELSTILTRLFDVDVQFLTEIDGSVMDVTLHDRSPEVQLVSARLAAMAIVDVPLHVDAE